MPNYTIGSEEQYGLPMVEFCNPVRYLGVKFDVLRAIGITNEYKSGVTGELRSRLGLCARAHSNDGKPLGDLFLMTRNI
jgi:hypothetical protein